MEAARRWRLRPRGDSHDPKIRAILGAAATGRRARCCACSAQNIDRHGLFPVLCAATIGQAIEAVRSWIFRNSIHATNACVAPTVARFLALRKACAVARCPDKKTRPRGEGGLSYPAD